MIRVSFRAQDHVCRIGGDEFAVVMVLTNRSHEALVRNKAAAINEALRDNGTGLPPTHVSCGGAYRTDSDSEGVFRLADAALYSVKNRGGNGCAFSGEEQAL